MCGKASWRCLGVKINMGKLYKWWLGMLYFVAYYADLKLGSKTAWTIQYIERSLTKQRQMWKPTQARKSKY